MKDTKALEYIIYLQIALASLEIDSQETIWIRNNALLDLENLKGLFE